MPAPRNALIEALRIAAMVGIVAHHYVVHGDVLDQTASANTAVFLAVFGSCGKWGVDLFVLVSAYFMVERASRGKTLSRVYAETLPVSWLVLAVAAATGVVTLSRTDVLRSVVPVIFGQYWFVTAFVVLVLIAPYLTIVARALTKVQLQRLLVGAAVMWSVLTLIDGVWLGLSNLAWFATLYMMAAYVRLHGLPGTARQWAVGAAVTGGLLVAVVGVGTAVVIGMHGDASSAGWVMDVFASEESPFSAAFAMAALGWAIKMPPRTSGAVVTAASATFAVYLLHDNPLIRRVLWTDWLDTPAASGQWWLPLHALGSTALVYVACTLVALVLQRTLFRMAHRGTEAVRTRINTLLSTGDSKTA